MKTKAHNIKIVAPVTYGNGLGGKLGFPTANLSSAPDDIREGVWAAIAQVAGRSYKAVVNVGYSPSVIENGQRRVEVHIVDFEGNLYEQEVGVELRHYLREERKFASREALIEQIGRDREEAIRILEEDE